MGYVGFRYEEETRADRRKSGDNASDQDRSPLSYTGSEDDRTLETGDNGSYRTQRRQDVTWEIERLIRIV